MEPTNTPVSESNGKSKKKKLYVAIVIVVVIVLIALSSGRSRSTRLPNGVNMERGANGSATYTSNDTKVSVGINKLPDNWPSDAPQYPNASIQYSGSTNPQTGAKGASVAFTTTDSADKVAEFYKKELAAKGWNIEQTANIGGATVISAKKDTRTIGAYIVTGDDGKTSVTIGITL